MNKMNRSIRNLTNRIILSYIIVLLTILVVYPVEILEFTRNEVDIERRISLIILMILLIILLSTIIYVFIYKPIRIIEKSISCLKIGKDNNKIINSNNFFDIISNLSNIINSHEKDLIKDHSVEILNQRIHFSELQSQINPHFLYNTLESIRGQAIEDCNYVIANMIEALGKYFRYSISNKSEISILKDELQNILNYIEIQKYRYEDKIQFEIKFEEESEEILNCRIPKLTLQPIVENAIYHGLETKEGKGKLSIRIDNTEERVIIIITDDGVGMECTTLEKLKMKINNLEGELIPSTNIRNSGIAMSNVNKRLKLLFGSEYGITISSTVKLGTQVEIVIPLQFNED